jgi:prepilin-type N-terminal cleavage/methylation domain-containing protein
MRPQRGFSLIEIAVVIGIIGFLAFMITPLIGSQLSIAKIRETRAKLDPVKAAIVAFVAGNSRLPCPAVENLPSTDPQYGREAATPGTCTGTTALTGGASRGVIPWLTLGLTPEAATDAFGRFFTYVVTTNQTSLSSNTLPGMTGVIAIHNATPVAAGNQINAGNLAVFALVSHGTNGYGAFNPGSGNQTPFPPSPGADESENANTSNVAFVDKTFSDITGNPFDDMVLWVTPREILAALGPSGVKTPQGAMSDKFAGLRGALLAYMTADNGSPGGGRTYGRRVPCADITNDGVADCANSAGGVPWTTMRIPQTAATDAWGNVIRYTVVSTGNHLLLSSSGANAGVQASTASTSTVTFASNGPDGAAGTGDDVTFTITAPELGAALLAAGVPIDP